MRFQYVLSAQAFISSSLAVTLYTTSYAGHVRNLQLTNSGSSYSLTTKSSNTGLSPHPAWLDFHPTKPLVYGVNENWWGPDGSLVAFSVNADGSLTQIDKKNTGRGSISNVIYNNGNAVAIANYETNGIQTFSISSTGTLTLLQTIQWTMSTKGPNSRQDRPRPHQTIVDPTGNFIVVCDLGADRIRILSINKSTSQLTEQTPIIAPAGSGPRHATFYKASNGTQYLFVVSELANTITSYRVTYGNNGSSLSLVEVFRSSQWGSTAVPAGSTGAEVIVSPDNRFLLTTSRLNGLSTGDTMQSWLINQANGSLELKQNVSVGGKTPRHISLNRNGTLAAVSLQDSQRVVIFSRDVSTGTLGQEVARLEGMGGVNAAYWRE